jgi:hypothetical protein
MHRREARRSRLPRAQDLRFLRCGLCARDLDRCRQRIDQPSRCEPCRSDPRYHSSEEMFASFEPCVASLFFVTGVLAQTSLKRANLGDAVAKFG